MVHNNGQRKVHMIHTYVVDNITGLGSVANLNTSGFLLCILNSDDLNNVDNFLFITVNVLDLSRYIYSDTYVEMFSFYHYAHAN